MTGIDDVTAMANPYVIAEREYSHSMIRRVLEVSVGDQLVAGAWKQPMSSDWSINIIFDISEHVGLPCEYLDFALGVRDENEARRVLQFLGLLYSATLT